MTSHSKESSAELQIQEPKPIETLSDYLKRVREVEASKFLNLNSDAQEPILARAAVLRTNPSGYDDLGALEAAISEIIPATDDEIGVSEEDLTNLIAKSLS